MDLSKLLAGERIDLGTSHGRSRAHVFETSDVRALEAALLTGRPLLLKGEPGVGKSQMALAAAKQLERGYVHKVVDSGTEARDLLWDEDLVERLAHAQTLGKTGERAEVAVSEELDIRKFVRPGVLWIGFNREKAQTHCKDFRSGQEALNNDMPWPTDNGMVVLIDEIDKAESDVPNGLLEVLGDRRFTPRGYDHAVEAQSSPLVIITTNQERPLPPAFLRRCIVHEIKLEEGSALIERLVKRGLAHFPELDDDAKGLVREAAALTVGDREKSKQLGLNPLPGQAEFIDLLNAVFSRSLTGRSPKEALDELSPFILRKHTELLE